MQTGIKYQYYTTWYSMRPITREVTWDDHYGNGILNKFRFGLVMGGEIVKGAKAYNYLVNTGFLDRLPNFYIPQPYADPPEGWNADMPYPNPNYQSELEAFAAAKAALSLLLHEELTLICQTYFPEVRDYGNRIRWWKLQGGQWMDVPVEVGKYPGEYKWVTVTEPDHKIYNAFIGYATACNDKDYMLRVLLQYQL